MIYMDNAATTAVRKEVAEAMLPYLLGLSFISVHSRIT